MAGILLIIINATIYGSYTTLDNENGMIVVSDFRDTGSSLFLMTDNGIPLRRLTSPFSNELIIAHSSDGQWLIIRSLATFNYIAINVATGSQLELIANTADDFLAFSADSNWVYFKQGRSTRFDDPYSKVYRISLIDGSHESLIQQNILSQIISVSPDNKWLVLQWSTVIRVNTQTAEVYMFPPDSIINSGEFKGWSLDSQQMFIAHGGGESPIVIYRIQTDGTHPEEVFSTNDANNVILDIDALQYGWLFATVIRNNSSYEYYRFRPDGSHLTQIEIVDEIYQGWIEGGEWVLVYTDSDDRIDTLTIKNVTSNQLLQIATDFRDGLSVTLNRDRFLFRDGSNYFIFESSRNPSVKVLLSLSPYEYLSFRMWSPNGDWLYFEDDDSFFRINAFNGKRETVFTSLSDSIHRKVFLRWIPLNERKWDMKPNSLISLFLIGLGLAVSNIFRYLGKIL